MVELRQIRIPFDNLTLEAVVQELNSFVGSKVQEIRQPNEFEVSIALYAGGREAAFFLSCHPVYFRAHFITKRLSNQSQPPIFCSTLRARLEGGRLVEVNQVQNDRLLMLEFESPAGPARLIAELMGKHSNLILVDGKNRILSAAKWVGASKSSRPIQPNGIYALPPVMTGEGNVRRSPFLQKLLEASKTSAVGLFQPVLSPGHGAYPVSVAALGLPEFPRASISIALEQHYARLIPELATDQLRTSLLNQLNRTLLAKEVAISDLRQAEEAGGRAPLLQRYGELILAYGASALAETSELDVWDYDGSPMKIRLDPELDFKSNANYYFDRAKKAKARMGLVLDQLQKLTSQHVQILTLIERVRTEERLDGLKAEAIKNRWLVIQSLPTANKDDRPFAGHRIREIQGPGGYAVLFGENAESNDYLTLRVAKPNDYWLHVRGDTSAHVVIVTGNHPEKVQLETLQYAAKVAVQNSKAKHAGYVSVDYTLKKYVRKPRGGAKGTALYSNEKTLHVEKNP